MAGGKPRRNHSPRFLKMAIAKTTMMLQTRASPTLALSDSIRPIDVVNHGVTNAIVATTNDEASNTLNFFIDFYVKRILLL